MPEAPRQDVTELLRAWQQGDAAAVERLMPIVYDELRRVARARLRHERPGHTLQATALVHEAYIRLIGSQNATPVNRLQLFAMAARVMREILVDHARRRDARKRGGDVSRIALDDGIAAAALPIVDVLALDEALDELAAREARLCR